MPVLKTLVFRCRARIFLIVVGQHDKLHYGKVASFLHEKRQDLTPLDPTLLEELLHQEVGGVGPVGIPPDYPILIDQSVMNFDQVICGSGRRGENLKIRTTDLLAIENCMLGSFVRET